MSTYNERRAADGLMTLKTYMQIRAEKDRCRPDHDEQYVDLITDVLHAARTHGHDVEAIIRMAQSHMEAEHGDPDLNAEDGDE